MGWIGRASDRSNHMEFKGLITSKKVTSLDLYVSSKLNRSLLGRPRYDNSTTDITSGDSFWRER